MIKNNTPVEDYIDAYGLWVKREDLCSPTPGPPFSKTRGVFAHLKKRPEHSIGVLDTFHSQAGWAVAHACSVLGKKCINFYPEYKNDPGHRLPQDHAKDLGAKLVGLPAGRSAVLYHGAKKHLVDYYDQPYMMPNALKLDETVEETAKEYLRTQAWFNSKGKSFSSVLIPSSSATIASGVIKGILESKYTKGMTPIVIIHLGYSRSKDAVYKYISQKVGADLTELPLHIVDEGYQYKDKASQKDIKPTWPCNEYYDLKAFQWWMSKGIHDFRNTLLWNIG